MSTRSTVALVAVTLAALLAGCRSAPRESVGSAARATTAVDDGAELTLWTRLAADSSPDRPVTRYDATHRNRVELTSVPGDSHLQKAGAGSGALPHLPATDVVHASGPASKDVLLDLTRRVGPLPYRDRLAPGPVEAPTVGEKLYAIPAVVDVSALFSNKVLHGKAGLDSDEPPTTLTEEIAQAQEIRALGGGISGSYFAGDCPGRNMFTGADPETPAADNRAITTALKIGG